FRIPAVHQVSTIGLKIDAHIIVGALIGTHADTETIIKGMITAHEHHFDIFPKTLIIIICRSIIQVHIIQSPECMEVTAAQKNNSTLLGTICLSGFALRKEK